MTSFKTCYVYGNANEQRPIPKFVSIAGVVSRCYSHSNGPAPYIHWMDALMSLYSAATFLNIGIAYYSSADGNPLYNYLVLPLRKHVLCD